MSVPLPALALVCCAGLFAAEYPKPYSAPCVEREEIFEFTQKPTARIAGQDRYEITFAVKGRCDVTVGVVDGAGKVVRHLGSGVLGENAPAPFQKNSLKQTLHWNGKDDLGAYPRQPEKLSVRVQLGLRPEFDKNLGDTNPKNLPGYVCGLAATPECVYVMCRGNGSHGHVSIRKFGHEGGYQGTLLPPPAGTPPENLERLGQVEYEPGRRALHAPDLSQTIATDAFFTPNLGGIFVDTRLVVAGKRLLFPNSGFCNGTLHSLLYHLPTDGTTDAQGLEGRPFAVLGKKELTHGQARLAVSPDGLRIYVTGFSAAYGAHLPVILTCASSGNEEARVFAGDPKEVGADDTHLNQPLWIDTDGAGRVYVADHLNNRIQVYSPEGKLVKTLPVERPRTVLVHKRSGGIYVFHAGRVQGRTVARLTKFHSCDDPREVFHQDSYQLGGEEVPLQAALMELDSWAPKPRLWLAGSVSSWGTGGAMGGTQGVKILEDVGTSLRLVEDFDHTIGAGAGNLAFGKWSGCGPHAEKVVCDPVREQVWYGNRHFFDLKTGHFLGEFRIPGEVDDVAFDRHGYVHIHLNPGYNTHGTQSGVVRLDPGQATRLPFAAPPTAWDRLAKPTPRFALQEVPYDYGEEVKDLWRGRLPVKDQGGACFFQHGIGASMYGQVAEIANIYYVPKTEDNGMASVRAEVEARSAPGGTTWGGARVFTAAAEAARAVLEAEKRGERVYSVRQRPGIGLIGSTVWTWERSGELLKECAVSGAGLINGVQVDEDDNLYFVVDRIRQLAGQPFLAGRGAIIGLAKEKTPSRFQNPFTGTLLKTRGADVDFLSENAQVPLVPLPQQPPDLVGGKSGARCWVEGAHWLYAGASPIVNGVCVCPTQRSHLDWYKRVYVPEAYRHSFGVLDTNGNLILHFGRYANFDSCHGPRSLKPLEGEQIPVLTSRFISGTDNFLCYDYYGEALVVVRLKYHAEETVALGVP